MARYAVVDGGKVVNIILLDEKNASTFKPDVGELRALADDEDCQMGDAVGEGGQLNRAPPPEPQLADVQAGYVRAIDMAFKRQQASVFVGPERREELRKQALAAIDAVNAATTPADVKRVGQAGLDQLKQETT